MSGPDLIATCVINLLTPRAFFPKTHILDIFNWRFSGWRLVKLGPSYSKRHLQHDSMHFFLQALHFIRACAEIKFLLSDFFIFFSKQIEEAGYFTQELSLDINNWSHFVEYPHYPIACCLPHL